MYTWSPQQCKCSSLLLELILNQFHLLLLTWKWQIPFFLCQHKWEMQKNMRTYSKLQMRDLNEHLNLLGLLTLNKSEKYWHNDDSCWVFQILHKAKRNQRKTHQCQTKPNEIWLPKAFNHSTNLGREYDQSNWVRSKYEAYILTTDILSGKHNWEEGCWESVEGTRKYHYKI